MIYETILRESQRIDEKIKEITVLLNELPEGNFYCTQNGKYVKWIHRKEDKQICIPKTNLEFAQKLAYRKYLMLQREDLLREQTALNYYLRHHTSFPGQAEKLLSKNSEYMKLLQPYFQPVSQELDEWMNAHYEKSEKYPEQLTHKTSTGNLVRSKSEAIIALFLHTNRIPFRYECALHLDEKVFYPDFTIRDPKTGEYFYWEHFGLMDDPVYYRNAYSKMQTYTSYGIIPSKQLITTYETKEYPLSTEVVEKIVKYYFCS